MMIDRRTLIAGAGALAALPAHGATGFASRRPPPARRRFVSPAVEREIVRVSATIADRKLRWMFGNCWPNTLDTTVTMGGTDAAPDAFVITGDIPCLWLRDSAAQLKPYLHLVKRDPALDRLFRGLIARHARCVLIDPYANAFMADPTATTGLGWAQKDETEMRPGVAERKWEIDSLCYAVQLAHGYWTATRDRRPFDATWLASARAIVRTFREQQRRDDPGPYRFRRASNQPSETLLWGYGNPTRKVGLIHSGFRPSDDACLYPFLIPANMFAVRSLRQLAGMVRDLGHDPALAADAAALADEVARALDAYGRMRLRDGREVWAYEVDGYGNAVFMDDANVPSLSSLAHLGLVDRDAPLFRATEAAAWSDANPWFFRGRAGEGIGGPHVGAGQIWPMSIVVRAFSTDDDATIRACLKTLRDTDGGTGFIHETFDRDDPARFTRDWFAWANGLFGELIVRLADTGPHLLSEPL